MVSHSVVPRVEAEGVDFFHVTFIPSWHFLANLLVVNQEVSIFTALYLSMVGVGHDDFGGQRRDKASIGIVHSSLQVRSVMESLLSGRVVCIFGFKLL